MTNRQTVLLSALTSAIIFALLVGIGQVFINRPVQAQDGTIIGRRQVTVVGQGEIKARPDTAYVQIGVETDAKTTQEALDENNQQVNAIMRKLSDLGIAETDVQTRNFNIYANYDNNGRRIRAYHVGNTVAVTIRDLDQTGELLDQVVQVGANSIYGIRFGVDDPSALLDQARDKALADAQAKAEQMAQSTDANLGEVIEITENIGATPPMPMVLDRALAQEESASAVPVATGEQNFNVNVQVTFELR